MLLSRDVRDRVERGDPVERALGELEGRDVRADEGRRGDTQPRKIELFLREVDAEDIEGLRQPLCGGAARAAPEVQDTRRVWQRGDELRQEEVLGVVFDAARPRRVTVAERVVAGADRFLARLQAGA